MRTVLRSALALALMLSAGAAAPVAAAPGWRLERVVLVMRHGVRPPTASNAELAELSAEPWPAWPVAPGELTPHGAKVVGAVAEGVRHAYAGKGLLPAAACPAAGEVQVWADSADQRTRRSGDAFAEGFAPGCGLVSRSGPPGAPDPLFRGAGPQACPVDPDRAKAAVEAAARPSGIVDPPTQRALARLQQIVAPEGCTGGKGVCLSGPAGVATTAKGVKLTGPIATGATLAENLFLEHAEGKPAAEVGWGRADGRAIAEVMPAHERAAALTRSVPYLAYRHGGVIAGYILRALDGRTAPGDPPAGRRLTVLVGHDTTLSSLQGVFGLSWRLPGQPDSTAPATALAFELWRSPRGEAVVRTRVFYLPLEAMRSLDGSRVAEAPTQPAKCAAGHACSPAMLTRVLEAGGPAECRAP